MRAQTVSSLDTNGDGVVAPLDVLIVINHLNASGPGPTPAARENLDVNKDGFVVPIDVLMVINALNLGIYPRRPQEIRLTGPAIAASGPAGFQWTPVAPAVAIRGYRWRVRKPDDSLTSWTATTLPQATLGPEISTAGSYRLEILAQYQPGYWSGLMVHLFTVDLTAPSRPVVTDDGAFTPSFSQLHAVWSSADPESGIAEYQYRIRSGSVTGPLVADWTSTGAAASVTRGGLSLIPGTAYFFAVRARNGAGAYSSPGYSDGIQVRDTTPPSVPVVTDDGEYSIFAGQLRAAWSSSDPESGIAEYQYRIIRRDGTRNFVDTVIVDWTSAGPAGGVTRAGLSLAEGKKYLFIVKARNGAGLWSAEGVSDGVVVDATPPSIPAVVDDGVYTTSNTQLHARWTSGDAVSGVVRYEYAIGTSPGNTDVTGWTSIGLSRRAPRTDVTRAGLALSDGTRYFFAVKALNGAGLWSPAGASNGIRVDTTPPGAPQVFDDGETTPLSSSLHARWSGAQDPQSGITQYRYQITEGSPSGTVVAPWTSAGTATEVTRAGLSLGTGGAVYYISVQARNGAGLWGPAGASDGIRVANQPPVLEPIGDKQIRVLPPPAPSSAAPAGGGFTPAAEEPMLFVKVSPVMARRMTSVVLSGKRLRLRAHPAHLRRILQGATGTLPARERRFSERERELTLEELCCRHQVMRARPVFARSRRAARTALGNVFQLDLSVPGGAMPLALEEFLRHSQVVYCEPRKKMGLFVTPNDPYLNSSGSWSQSYPDLWGLKRIQAEEAWDVTAGSPDVVVAVIDTGIDPNHADLFPNLWRNPREIPGNKRDDDGNGYTDDTWGWDFVSFDDGVQDGDPSDGHGHGTHVAGTIAAVGGNGQGIVGVAWNCRVMALKGLSDEGYGATDDLAQAIVYAADNGARVINMSWGGEGESRLLEDALRYAHNKGLVLVAAAGNSNKDAAGFTPANVAEVVTVASSDEADFKSDFSNWGGKIDVAAPGGGSTDTNDPLRTYINILSCRAQGTDIYGDGSTLVGEYARARGTSMAAPHVSGVCALIAARHPEFSNEQIRQALRLSADDVADPLNNGTSYPGRDPYTGYGRVNASRAVRLDDAPVAKITAPNPGSSVPAGVVRITGTASGPGFLRYAVEVGEGRYPAAWTRIYSSGSPVESGNLAVWDAAGREGQVWAVRLLVEAEGFPGPAEDAIHLNFLPPQAEGWPAGVGTRVSLGGLESFIWRYLIDITSPIVADLEGDGLQEIVTDTLFGDGRLFVFDPQGRVKPGWPVQAVTRLSGSAYVRPFLVGDIDGDGDEEIVVTGFGTDIKVFHHDGSMALGWPQPGRASLLADLDGDGLPEILGTTAQGAPMVWRGDGGFWPGWTAPPGAWIPEAAGDMDGDGEPEIVGRAPNAVAGDLAVWRADGTLVPGWPLGRRFTTRPVLADLDGDGDAELIIVERVVLDRLVVFQHDGSAVPGWNHRMSSSGPDPSVGDLDGDGRPEVVVALRRRAVSAYRSDGTPLWGFDSPAAYWRNLSIGDLDGDGLSEVLVGAYNRIDLLYSGGAGANVISNQLPGLLYCLQADGSVKAGWPLDSQEQALSIPVFADVDRDGSPDIVVGGHHVPGESVRVNAWRVGTESQAPRRVPWPVSGQNGWRTNLAPPLRVNGEAGTLAFYLQARDPNLDPLTYAVSGLPPGAYFNTRVGYFRWSPSADQGGVYPLTFSVSDGSSVVSESITITVRSANSGPRLSIPVVSYTVNEGDLLEFTASATDPDADPVQFLGYELPRGAAVDRRSGRFAWRPDFKQGGLHRFSLAAGDGSLEDRLEISVRVNNVNRAPQLTLPDTVTLREGEILEFLLNAMEPDGDPVAFSAAGLPPGAALDPGTGLFSWQPDFTQAGNYGSIRITVSDGALTETKTLSLTVQNAQPWTTPPVGPVLEGAPAATNMTALTLAGTKPAYTSVWVNGTEVAARDRLTTWTAAVQLTEGSNTVFLQARDVAGLSSFTVESVIVLDTVAPAVTVTSPAPGQAISLAGGSGGGG